MSPAWLAAETSNTSSPRASSSARTNAGDLLGIRDVGLVERDEAGTIFESAVRRELCLDHVEVGQRIAARIDRRAVDDVHQRGAALDVAQELVAEPATFARALDQSGHVGDGERGRTGGDDTEVGDQRRERVVGDLGPSARHRSDEARLAGAREADEADVGDDLELEGDRQLVARLTLEGEAGSLALGGRESGVAEPTAATRSDDELGAVTDQVGEDLARLIAYDGAVGNEENEVFTLAAAAVVARTRSAVGALAVRLVVVVDQRGDVGVDLEDDVAAVSAVAAVRPAEGLELLAVHRGDTVATGSARDVERHLVDEAGNSHGVAPFGTCLSTLQFQNKRWGSPLLRTAPSK